MGNVNDRFSAEFIRFIHGRGDRRDPGFQFVPGMMVWYDFLTRDSPYFNQDDWVLSRGPEHRVVKVVPVGNRFEVTIDVGDEQEEFEVHWGEHLVPYIVIEDKVAAINKHDDEHHFVRKGGVWWLLTFGDNPSIRISRESEIGFLYSQMINSTAGQTNKNT